VHAMLRRIPAIEVADDAHSIRRRRPNSESDAPFSVARERVRAELIVDTQMLAFAEEMEIEFAEYGRKNPCGTLRLCACA
jgi:hypothetical protein